MKFQDKRHLYTTAFWGSIGHFVRLVKYHARLDYYTVETPAGEHCNVAACELSRFTI